MDYAVLIMDIVKSKKYSPETRQILQELIECSLEYLNELFVDGLQVRVSFSGGDEVQGMFRSCGNAFLYCRFLSLILGKGIMRAGIGKGSWDVKMEGAPSASQDGEAYHRARRAIELAHFDPTYDLWFDLGEGATDGYEEVLTVLADHSLGAIDFRTDNQNDIALYHEVVSPVAQRENKRVRESVKRDMLALRSRLRECEHSGSKKSAKRPVNIAEIASAAEPEAAPPLFQTGRKCVLDFALLPESKNYFVYMLAKALGKSRQAIEDQIRRARINQERNAAAYFVHFCDMHHL